MKALVIPAPDAGLVHEHKFTVTVRVSGAPSRRDIQDTLQGCISAASLGNGTKVEDFYVQHVSTVSERKHG